MKKTLHFKVLAGVVAMLLVLPTVGFATTVDLGQGGQAYPFTGPTINDPGTLYVDATVSTTYNTPIFDVNGVVTVAPFDSTTIYNTPGTGVVGEQVVTVGSNVSGELGYNIIETLLDEDASLKTVEVDSGGVVIEPTGDVTLSGSTTYNSTVLTDTSKILWVDSDPASLTYGAVIYNSAATVEGNPTGTWVPGVGLTADEYETVEEDPIVGSDGNLDVGGDTLLRGDLEVLGVTDLGVTTMNSATITNDVAVGGGLVVAGDTSLAGLTAGDIVAGDIVAGDLLVGDIVAGDLLVEDIVAGDITAGNLDVGNIDALNINAGDITAGNLDVGDIVAGNLDVQNILAGDITAGNLDVGNINAGDINAGVITAGNLYVDDIVADDILAGTLATESDVYVGRDLYVAGDTTLDGDLYVDNGYGTVALDDQGFRVDFGEASTHLDMDATDITLTAADGEITLDTPQLTVTGKSDFGDTLTVAPQYDIDNIIVDENDDGELPGIGDNGDDTSTVFTQTGSVTHETSSAIGGGVTLETNGDVTLARAVIGGIEIDYLQVTKFLVDNDTGLAKPGTDERVGGYVQVVDGEEVFVELGPLVWEDGKEVLDFDNLNEGIGVDDLENITTILDPDGTGGSLLVEGDAHVYKGDELDEAATDLAREQFENDHEVVIQQELDAVATELRDDLDYETAARIEGDVYLETRIDSNRNKIDNNRSRINDLEDRVDAVGAFSAAFSALVPNDRVAGNTQVSLGLGTYSGETAIAAGLFHYFGDNILLNAGVSTSTDESETAGRAGITFGF